MIRIASTQVLRSLRHRNFRLFFAGQLVSLIGTWMQSVAQSWLVYRMTGSSAMLGWVGFAGQIPVFVLAPLGGLLADQRDRLRVLLGTQTAAMVLAFVLAWLTLSNRIGLIGVLVLSAALGVVNAFDIPTRQALVVQLVAREDMTNAIALNSSMVNGARIVGPGNCGGAGSDDRRGLVLLRQWRELFRGSGKPAANATRSGGAAGA